MKVFDMGKNIKPDEVFRGILQKPDVQAYTEGMVTQFLHDLLFTGRAVMPNGEVIEAFKPRSEFPVAPFAHLYKPKDRVEPS